MDKCSPLSETCYWAPEGTADTDRATDGIPYPLVARLVGPETRFSRKPTAPTVVLVSAQFTILSARRY
jgi:hypothetical protein